MISCLPSPAPATLHFPSHGQRLEFRVTDAGTEAGMDQLQVALADLVFATTLLQEVDLGRDARRGSFLGVRQEVNVSPWDTVGWHITR